MERETGIEPATSSLGSWRSTAELLPLRLHDFSSRELSRKGEPEFVSLKEGPTEARLMNMPDVTHDLHLEG